MLGRGRAGSSFKTLQPVNESPDVALSEFTMVSPDYIPQEVNAMRRREYFLFKGLSPSVRVYAYQLSSSILYFAPLRGIRLLCLIALETKHCTEADVHVLIRGGVIHVQIEHACIRTVIPVATDMSCLSASYSSLIPSISDFSRYLRYFVLPSGRAFWRCGESGD